MKKIISMGIASAVLAFSAVAAYADAAVEAPIAIMPVEDSPVAGSTFTVEITAAAAGEATQFNVVWTGLEYAEASYDDDAAAWAVNNAKGNNKLVYSKSFEPGDTIITLKFKVTAKAGEEVSVSLSEENAKFNLTTPVEQKWVAIEGGDTSDLTPSGSDSGSDSGSESTGDGTTNPPTGIALAIVPAVLAGAGVVVAKKRK